MNDAAPFASLLLADYGASVLRVDRPHYLAHSDTEPPPTSDLLTRHKSSIALDLKASGGIEFLKDLLRHVDVLIEPFRPGVLESLLLAPKDLLALNPRLIIARLSGFRKDGPYKFMAGHDINYLAVSGILSQLGRTDAAPYPPANILADFAGGGLMCALGILLALFQRTTTGMGQVVENNMVDGAAYLGSFMRYALKSPIWNRPRGQNLLDGGCPWYDVYACKDGGYMAVGALEPKFFQALIQGLGLSENGLSDMREDRSNWPAIRKIFQDRFLQRTRDEWTSSFHDTDACCTPVIDQCELEASGYEQRIPISLSASAKHSIDPESAWMSYGLAPGHLGEDRLANWTGWRRGIDYRLEGGGLIKNLMPKL